MAGSAYLSIDANELYLWKSAGVHEEKVFTYLSPGEVVFLEMMQNWTYCTERFVWSIDGIQSSSLKVYTKMWFSAKWDNEDIIWYGHIYAPLILIYYEKEQCSRRWRVTARYQVLENVPLSARFMPFDKSFLWRWSKKFTKEAGLHGQYIPISGNCCKR